MTFTDDVCAAGCVVVRGYARRVRPPPRRALWSNDGHAVGGGAW